MFGIGRPERMRGSATDGASQKTTRLIVAYGMNFLTRPPGIATFFGTLPHRVLRAFSKEECIAR
jgi:hypothetical protein